LVPATNIFVATASAYQEKTEELLPDIAKDHLFYEPEKRDTTAAFATVALRLQAMGLGDEPTLFMWCDHVFTREDVFLADLRLIPDVLAANPNTLVIVGHTPLSPATSFGYFEVGDTVGESLHTYQVKRFIEKPDEATAQQFVAKKNYFWNLGYFSLRPAYLLQQLQLHAPELESSLAAFGAALATNDTQAQEAAYGSFPKLALEYTFVEKTENIMAITGDYGWSDVGNWHAVSEVFGVGGDHMPAGHHIHVDAKNNYIYNTTNKVVSLIGVENIVAVVTDDAVLITKKDSAARVKEVVQQLEEQGKGEYL
jgi:mannose-1-phosphate guanylyltransferase